MAEPSIAADVSDRFDHVLVDEYQDTNRLQASVLLALKPTGKGLTVVGDDAQSIYSFRAATVRNILDFRSLTLRPRLPLNATHPGRLERRNGARRRGVHQEPMVRAGIERTSPSRHCF